MITTRIPLQPENKIPGHVKLLKQSRKISYFSRAVVLKAWSLNKVWALRNLSCDADAAKVENPCSGDEEGEMIVKP